METIAPKNSKATVIAAAIAVTPPLLIWLVWIIIYNSYPGKSFKEKESIYLNCFPNFMRGMQVILLTGVFFCIVSIVLSRYSLKQKNTFSKAPAISILVVASVILLLSLFSMM
jgi:hypothetical protein